MTVFATLTGIVEFGSGAVLSVAFAAVLVHIMRGSKNGWLIRVVTLMLVGSVAWAIQGVYFWLLIVKKGYTKINVWIYVTAISTGWFFFLLTHYLLAELYAKIAEEVPAHLEGKETPPRTKCDAVKHWVMVTSIFVGSVMLLTSCGIYYSLKFVGQENVDEHTGVIAFKILAKIVIQVLLMFPAYSLTMSVVKIKNYFKDKEENIVNTKMLNRHLIAFGVLLAISAIFLFAIVFMAIYSNSTLAFTLFEVSASLFFLGELVSQLVLCRILWEWGTKSTPDQAVKDLDIFPEVLV